MRRRVWHTAGVVAGGQEYAARGLALADEVAGSRRRQNAVPSDEELLDSVRDADLGDQLNGLRVPVSSVAADDEESSSGSTEVRRCAADPRTLSRGSESTNLELLRGWRAGCWRRKLRCSVAAGR